MSCSNSLLTNTSNVCVSAHRHPLVLDITRITLVLSTKEPVFASYPPSPCFKYTTQQLVNVTQPFLPLSSRTYRWWYQWTNWGPRKWTVRWRYTGRSCWKPRQRSSSDSSLQTSWTCRLHWLTRTCILIRSTSHGTEESEETVKHDRAWKFCISRIPNI